VVWRHNDPMHLCRCEARTPPLAMVSHPSLLVARTDSCNLR
jgi:hypothetical protein